MKKVTEIPAALAKLQRIKGSSDDKRANLEFLNEQRRLADDFELCLRTALVRGYPVELAVIIDGQVSVSSVMLNSKRTTGEVVLSQLLRVVSYERRKILSQIDGFMSLPNKDEGNQ